MVMLMREVDEGWKKKGTKREMEGKISVGELASLFATSTEEEGAPMSRSHLDTHVHLARLVKSMRGIQDFC